MQYRIINSSRVTEEKDDNGEQRFHCSGEGFPRSLNLTIKKIPGQEGETCWNGRGSHSVGLPSPSPLPACSGRLCPSRLPGFPLSFYSSPLG